MTKTIDRGSSYRADIDGIRGLAIALVVGYHTFPELLPGGFVGVDVFFVISGYIITRNISGELERGEFSLLGFYARRVRRLMPALLIVLAAVSLMGWLLLLEHEYRELGRHIFSGSAFISNITLWRELGYFDSEAAHKPLRHLWSLGVEEQFYLVWPLILLLLAGRVRGLVVAILLVVLSFVAGLLVIEDAPMSAFYLPHLRLWEILAGAIIALGSGTAGFPCPPKLREALPVVGGGAILIAAYQCSGNSPFPGFAALAPVLGTVLMILAPGSFISRAWLSSRGLVFLGLISYPLYLWHWPLLAFARILYWKEAPILVTVALIALSLVLAWATYRWLERPVRTHKVFTRDPLRILVVFMPLVVLTAGAGLLMERRVPQERLSGLSAVLSAACEDHPITPPSDLMGDIPGTVLFIGDSYLGQFAPRIEEQHARLSGPKRSVTFHFRVGCPPVPGLGAAFDPGCGSWAEQGFQKAASPQVHAVVIGCSWVGMRSRGGFYSEGDPHRSVLDLHDPRVLKGVLRRLESDLAALVTAGKEVHLLLNPPGGEGAHPADAGKARLSLHPTAPVKRVPRIAQEERMAEVNDLLRALAMRVGAFTIDPVDWVCDEDSCAFTDENGVPYYSDATHFRTGFVRCCVNDLDELLLPGPTEH